MDDEQGKLFDTVQEPEQGTTETDAEQDENASRKRLNALELLRQVREQWEQMKGTGRYVLLPTEALVLRGEAFFNLYVDDVTHLLNTSGVTDTETVERVVMDYGYTLIGFYDFITLPLHKQAEVLAAVKPWKLHFTEKYGLTLLFGIYLYNVETAKDYIKRFKYATGDVERTTKFADGTEEKELFKVSVEEQKAEYLRRTIYRIASGTTPLLAGSFRWIGRNKVRDDNGDLVDIVEPSDFTGVEPELSNKYFAYIEAGAGLDYYANYYFIGKYALRATPEELKDIDAPPIFGTPERVQEYAKRIANQRYKNIKEMAAEVEKAIAAETAEERGKARQEVTTTPDTEETIRIPENIALLGSRDVYASVNGTEITEQGVIPISKVIAIYGQRKELPANVTPYTVERTIQGLNMLQRFNHNAPVGGWYTYETNITEFSQLCGYDNANGEEMAAIMHSLMILRDLYVIVWKPKGRVAIQLLTVPQVGVSGELKGRFKLQVSAEALRGHQNFTTIGEIRNMQKKAKGQAQFHFNSQLIAKGQKEENALISEVFGYDTMLREAAGNPETERNVREFIRKNKPNHRKKVAKWFEEYKQNGLLESYSRTKNARGEYIYKWKRGNVPNPQEPDEQGGE